MVRRSGSEDSNVAGTGNGATPTKFNVPQDRAPPTTLEGPLALVRVAGMTVTEVEAVVPPRVAMIVVGVGLATVSAAIVKCEVF